MATDADAFRRRDDSPDYGALDKAGIAGCGSGSTRRQCALRTARTAFRRRLRDEWQLPARIRQQCVLACYNAIILT
jgi:hypothetical protein